MSSLAPNLLARSIDDPDALERAIEVHDLSAPGHKDRVAALAGQLASAAGMSQAGAAQIARAGRRHDVGKLWVPVPVLTKPGRLSAEERALIQRHATDGARLLTDAGAPVLEIEVAEAHHERWDGRGYPHGRAGLDIPLAARLVSLADVYDALSAHRPYQPGMPQAQVLALMTGEMRGAFDPDLLALLVEIAPGLRNAAA